MFTGSIITNEDEHQVAIDEVESLFGSMPGTVGYARVHHLVDIIQAYERTIWQVPPATAEDMAEFRRDQGQALAGALVAA